MSTIPETMKIIANDIQNTFEELMKLLLRKTLPPILNPLGPNTSVIYNTYLGRYERGFVGSVCDDSINRYNYIMTHDSLGWTDDVMTNFKAVAKFIKNSIVPRFPESNTKLHNSIKLKSKVPFTDLKKISKGKTPNLSKSHCAECLSPQLTSSYVQYKNFLSHITTKTMSNIIANKYASFLYTSDIPYVSAFKQLESIGKDIIDQTDPSISGADSAKMSTSMLRVKLYNLEMDLADVSVKYPEIYDDFVEMIRLINSVPRKQIAWIINLIAVLSYQSWDDLSESQQQTFINIFGSDFMCAFNSNELITILLQSKASELILTCSYLYSLIKMLFITFGYSKLIPVVADNGYDEYRAARKDYLRKHLEKYRGATFLRGDREKERIQNLKRNLSNNLNHVLSMKDNLDQDIERMEPIDSLQPSRHMQTDLPVSEPGCGGDPSNPCGKSVFDPGPSMPQPEPIDQCTYDFIKLFGDLYPTIIGLMGGTEEFPPESIPISCQTIPGTYNNLSSLPEYLWRYNDYSYCRYIEYQLSRQITNALSSKINTKTRYLQML